MSGLDLDLKTVSVDEDVLHDVQLSFYKAAVMDCEVPHDHALWAIMYKIADEHEIPYIITGNNHATESILPIPWTYIKADAKHIRAIHDEFGNRAVNDFPSQSLWDRFVRYNYLNPVTEVQLLNYLPFDRDEIESTLEDEFGWKRYKGRHGESVITRFFQRYYLPEKFVSTSGKHTFLARYSRDKSLETKH